MCIHKMSAIKAYKTYNNYIRVVGENVIKMLESNASVNFKITHDFVHR